MGPHVSTLSHHLGDSIGELQTSHVAVFKVSGGSSPVYPSCPVLEFPVSRARRSSSLLNSPPPVSLTHSLSKRTNQRPLTLNPSKPLFPSGRASLYSTSSAPFPINPFFKHATHLIPSFAHQILPSIHLSPYLIPHLLFISLILFSWPLSFYLIGDCFIPSCRHPSLVIHSTSLPPSLPFGQPTNQPTNHPRPGQSPSPATVTPLSAQTPLSVAVRYSVAYRRLSVACRLSPIATRAYDQSIRWDFRKSPKPQTRPEPGLPHAPTSVPMPMPVPAPPRSSMSPFRRQQSYTIPYSYSLPLSFALSQLPRIIKVVSIIAAIRHAISPFSPLHQPSDPPTVRNYTHVTLPCATTLD